MEDHFFFLPNISHEIENIWQIVLKHYESEYKAV